MSGYDFFWVPELFLVDGPSRCIYEGLLSVNTYSIYAARRYPTKEAAQAAIDHGILVTPEGCEWLPTEHGVRQ